jgi:hypothetical protein
MVNLDTLVVVEEDVEIVLGMVVTVVEEMQDKIQDHMLEKMEVQTLVVEQVVDFI